MFSGKFDRGFDVLKNPNPRFVEVNVNCEKLSHNRTYRFFEFEARLPGYGCASSRRKQVEKLGGRFADILRLSDKLQDGDHVSVEVVRQCEDDSDQEMTPSLPHYSVDRFIYSRSKISIKINSTKRIKLHL